MSRIRTQSEIRQLYDYLIQRPDIIEELDEYGKEEIHKLYKDAGCSLLAELYQISLDKLAVREKISEFKRKMYSLRRKIITMSLSHLSAVVNSLNSVFFAVENEYTFVVHPKVGLFAATFPHKVLWNVGYLLPCFDDDDEFIKLVMCEEGFHWVFDHHSRGMHLIKSTSGMTPDILDIASDMSMYALLKDIAGDKADEYIDEHDRPQTHGFNVGLSFERYALLLRDKYYQEMLDQRKNQPNRPNKQDGPGLPGGQGNRSDDADNDGQANSDSAQGGKSKGDTDGSESGVGSGKGNSSQGGDRIKKQVGLGEAESKDEHGDKDGQGSKSKGKDKSKKGDKDGKGSGGQDDHDKGDSSSEVNSKQLNEDHLKELSEEARQAILKESKGTVVVVTEITKGDEDGEGKSGKGRVEDVKAVAGQALASLTETLKERGLGTGSLNQMLPRVKVKKMNWKAIIQDVFIRMKKEYSWAKPEKRLYIQGITIPSEFPVPSLPHIVLSFDQSGSMNDYECAAAAQWTIDLAKKFNFQKITLLIHDTEIVHRIEIESEIDTKLEQELFRRRTACGTDHAPVLKWIYENQKEYPPIAIYIGFTDGYSDFKGLDNIDPSVRVVWVITRNDNFTIDRGLVVHTDVLWDDK